MIILTREEQQLLYKIIESSIDDGILEDLVEDEVKLMVNLQYKLGKEL